MFSLIESKEAITKAQRNLERTIRRDFTKEAVKDIGYPGGTTYDAKVFTDGKYWYWPSTNRNNNSSNLNHSNWFGLFKEDTHLHISVEINIAYEGRSKVAGFFARDNDTGSIYLMHTGKIGGGTAGVGKTAFLAWGDKRPIDVVDSSGNVKIGVLVMPIEGVAASRSAVNYIDTIANFKQAVRAGDTKSLKFQHKEKDYADFFSEAYGRRKGKRSKTIDYLSRHGEVVNELYSWRLQNPLPRNGRLVKNVFVVVK